MSKAATPPPEEPGFSWLTSGADFVPLPKHLRPADDKDRSKKDKTKGGGK